MGFFSSSEVTLGQTFWQYVTYARGLFSQSRLLKARQSHCVWNAATEPFTPPGGWRSGSIISSITVNDKNRPLAKRYLSAYPVTAASSHMGSTRCLGPRSHCHKNCKQSKSDPWDPSGSVDRVMYRASNLRCDFHQTNTSQRGQDVAATPCTTTVIYTSQAETDVDDFKNGHLLGEDRVGIEISCGTVPFLGWMVGVYFRLRLARSKTFPKSKTVPFRSPWKRPAQDFTQRERLKSETCENVGCSLCRDAVAVTRGTAQFTLTSRHAWKLRLGFCR